MTDATAPSDELPGDKPPTDDLPGHDLPGDDLPGGKLPTDDLPTIEQRGLYYEELQTGVRYLHAPGKTFDDAENAAFTMLTMNPASIHLDAHASATNQFGRRLINSMLTLSTLVGLSVGQLTQLTTVANLGFRRVDFPRPVFGGDTIYASTVVLEKRLSRSRPDVGIVVLEHTARNQHGEIVAVAARSAMMQRRDRV